MDAFSKTIDKLGNTSSASPAGIISREITKTSNYMTSRGRTSSMMREVANLNKISIEHTVPNHIVLPSAVLCISCEVFLTIQWTCF